MKLKMLFGAICVSVCSVAAWGDPTCTSIAGESYSALAATGCMESFANYTVTISDFTAISPVGDGTSILVNHIDFNTVSGLLGLQFTGNNSSVPAFSSLGFTATVSCNPGFTCGIMGDYEQASFLRMGDTTGLVTVTASDGTSTISLTPTSSTYGPTSFADVSSFSESATYDGNNVLGNFETDIYSTSAPIVPTPEPTSILLLGSCVLGLGVIKRRTARKS